MQSDLAGLTVRLYETTLDGGDWRTAVEDIAATLGADMALFHVMETAGPRVLQTRIQAATPNLSAAALAEYSRDLVAHDPWAKLGAQTTGDVILPCSEIVPAETFAYQPRWRHMFEHGMPAWHLLAACFPITEHEPAFAALALQNRRGSGPFPRETAAHLAALLPHLRRAATVQARLAGHVGPLGEAAEIIPQGIAVLDAQMHPRSLNAAMRGLIAEGWFSHRLGALDAAEPGSAARLRTLVANAVACAAGTPAPAAGETALRHPRHDGAVMMLRVLPLRAPRPSAVLLIHAPGAARPPMEQTLREAWGLSRAEASLALAVYRGAALVEAAARRGVSLPTVKTQMRAILGKMGAERGQDMIRLIASIGA